MTGICAPTTLCLAAALAATTAGADVAPRELWQHWQQSRALTAGLNTGSGRVTLDAPTLSLPYGDGGQLTLSLDSAELTGDGRGGTVVSLPPGQSVTVRTSHADGTAMARLTLGGDGVRITAQGDLPAPDYALASDRLILSLAELRENDTDQPLPELVVTLDGLAGRLAAPDGTATRDLAATIETLTTAFVFDDAATATSVSATSAQSDLDLAAQLQATGPDAADWSGALTLQSGPATATTRQTGPVSGTFESDLGTDSARLRLAIDPATVSYAADTLGTVVSLRSDRLPVSEVELDIGEGRFGLTAPLPGSLDTPAGGTARLELHLADVTAGDALWSLYDPGSALPRTAAHLDLVAEAELTPIDPATRQAFAVGDAPGLPPLMPSALTISEFSLRFAEARIEADGSFTTEAAAGTGLPDVARPIGALDLTVTGAVTLLQRLMQGGLVTPEMALGAQMMLGMFSTPGEGDTVTSTIETEADGGLVVNGTRLR